MPVSLADKISHAEWTVLSMSAAGGAAICGDLLLCAASSGGGPARESPDAQLFAAVETAVPKGLILELAAAQDNGVLSAEFALPE